MVLVPFYLELHHLANTLELRQDIMVKLDERLLKLFLAVFQTSIYVVIIAPRLLHAKRYEHTTYHQSRAGGWISVLPRTSGLTRSKGRRIYRGKISLMYLYICSVTTHRSRFMNLT